MFDPGPCVYMEKIAVTGDLADVVDFNAPIEDHARAHREGPRRPRPGPDGLHPRPPTARGGPGPPRPRGRARIKFLLDGDVAGAIMAATPETNVDLMVGIGGTPEGVLAAARSSAWAVPSTGGSTRATTTSAAAPWTPATTSTRS